MALYFEVSVFAHLDTAVFCDAVRGCDGVAVVAAAVAFEVDC